MSTTTNFGQLQKPKRENIRKIKAESLKPAQEKIDESGDEKHEFFVVAVSNGVEKHHPSTRQAWLKSLGPKQKVGRPLRGLDNRIDADFYIIIDKESKLVVDIDVMPRQRYALGMVPEALQGVSEMIIKINQSTGGLEVLQMPPKIRDNKILTILDAIDKMDVISSGDSLAGYEVTSVGGDKVTIEISSESDDDEKA